MEIQMQDEIAAPLASQVSGDIVKASHRSRTLRRITQRFLMRMAMCLSLLWKTSVFAQDWTNVLIKPVHFDDVPLIHAIESLRSGVILARPGTQLAIRYELLPPDSRCSWSPTNLLRRLVSIDSETNEVHAGSLLSSLCEHGELECEVGAACVTIRALERGFLFVPPQASYRPGVYGRFDRMVAVPTNSIMTIADMLARVTEVTATEVILAPEFNGVARGTRVVLSADQASAFVALKGCVLALRMLTHSDLVLFVPNAQIRRDFVINRTGTSLGIGCRPKGSDIRDFMPLLVKSAAGPDHSDWWSASSNDVSQLYQAMEWAKDTLRLRGLFYEPELNAFWVIAKANWYVTLDYFDFAAFERPLVRAVKIDATTAAVVDAERAMGDGKSTSAAPCNTTNAPR
jgi:hypothetical protein